MLPNKMTLLILMSLIISTCSKTSPRDQDGSEVDAIGGMFLAGILTPEPKVFTVLKQMTRSLVTYSENLLARRTVTMGFKHLQSEMIGLVYKHGGLPR